MSDLPSDPVQRGLKRAVAVTRFVVGWERVWRASWGAVCLVGGFLVLALLDVLPLLPGWVHALVLAAMVSAVVLVLRRMLSGFRWPAEAEAARRLERSNGLNHRPLSLFDDRPATADRDVDAGAVWHRHRQTLLHRLGRLRVPLPHPGLAARDPFGLRAVVGVALVATAIGSWGDWGPRLSGALRPHLERGSSAPAALDAWVTPPAYTGLAPVFLARAGSGGGPSPAPSSPPAEQAVAVPEGSTLLAWVTGGGGVPRLSANDAERPFTVIDDDHFKVEDHIRSGPLLAITQGGRTLGHWMVTVTPVPTPVIAFVQPPGSSGRGLLHLDYTVSDPYGIDSVTAAIRPESKEDSAGATDSPLQLVPLPLPEQHPKAVHASADYDLTSSPLAGLPVLIQLTATGSSGARGTTAEVSTVLPERVFVDPVAKAIIAQRKTLALQGREARHSVAAALSDLSVHPGAFHDDKVVFLSLRVALARLLLDPDPGAIREVRDLLWETALRLEDGGLSLAERDLRQARQALAEALDRNAGEEELRRRLDDVQAALDRFLDTLDQQRQDVGASLPPDESGPSVDRADLEAMVQSLREMTETGARDGARQMLSDLGRLLDGLQTGGGDDAGSAQAQQILGQLQALTAREQDLLDRTFRQTQQDQTTDRGPRPPKPDAAEQDTLRQQLGSILQQLGEVGAEIPKPLTQAERAMRQAGQALGQGDPGAAVPPETAAVDALRQGLRGLGQSLSRSMAGGGHGPGSGHDPLGRRLPGQGTANTNGGGLPEQSDVQKAREILDELRRRAGQHDRSRQELDYIGRLLHQF